MGRLDLPDKYRDEDSLPKRKGTWFFIRSVEGDSPQIKLESPGTVLSKALTGTWEVWECDDLVCRVYRAKGSTFTVTVERM